MNKNISVTLSSQMFSLINRLQELKLDYVDPEISEKVDAIQELMADLYLSTEKRVKKIASDYSFLSRDHVFFDGDNNHSGAV